MGSFCKLNKVVVWRKASTCCTTCSHKDYILSLHSFFVMLVNYKWWLVTPETLCSVAARWAEIKANLSLACYFSQSGSSRWSSRAEARAICQGKWWHFWICLLAQHIDAGIAFPSSSVLVCCNFDCRPCDHALARNSPCTLIYGNQSNFQ